MIAAIRRTIQNESLLAKGDRVLVAVSGGVDSAVLLHVLVQLRAEFELTLGVVHVEHGLRGEESLADALFVERLAAAYELPFFMKRFDVASYAQQQGLSTQVAAREVRYRYLAQAAEAFGAQKVATAHHADDQAETILMRVLRGTTLHGLAGIPLRRTEQGFQVVRPLLEIERAQIEAYATAQGIFYREDASNASTKYLRNKIRIHLFPQLEREYNPSVKTALRQLAQLAQEDEEYLAQLAHHALAEVAKQEAHRRWRIDAKRLAGLSLSLQRRVITLILYYLHGNTKQWEQVHIANIRSLLFSDSPSAEIALPAGVSAWREYDSLYIGDIATRQTTADGFWPPVHLPGPGSYELPQYGIRLEWEVVSGQPVRPCDSWEVHFDADELSCSCIYIRTWATGDTIRPLGLAGSKLVSDVLGEAKVPRRERQRWPLLCVDEAIAWVVGIRRGQQALVTEQTSRTFVLRAFAHASYSE